jgi:hypothetical protein
MLRYPTVIDVVLSQSESDLELRLDTPNLSERLAAAGVRRETCSLLNFIETRALLPHR